MLGNWRTRSTEPHMIRPLGNANRPTGGKVDMALVNGRTRKRAVSAPAPKRPKKSARNGAPRGKRVR